MLLETTMLKESINVCLMKNWSAIPVPLKCESVLHCQTRQVTVLASLLSLYYPVCLASKNPNESRTIMKLQNTYTRNPSERFFKADVKNPHTLTSFKFTFLDLYETKANDAKVNIQSRKSLRRTTSPGMASLRGFLGFGSAVEVGKLRVLTTTLF